MRETLLNRPKDRPFCLFGSFCSPHPIIDPPRRFYDAVALDSSAGFLPNPDLPPMTPERQALWCENIRGYKALLRVVDEEVGRILDLLESEHLLENTVIVFSSDHGDMLGNRNVDGKNLPYRDSVTVPLAIRHPAYLHRRRVDVPVELTDVTATILDAAGLDPVRALSVFWPAFNDIIPCRSLLPILRGETDRVRDFAFSENHMWEMAQTDEWKYVRWRTLRLDNTPPREELYHLPTDPGEQLNVAGNPGAAQVLAWLRDTVTRLMFNTPAGQVRWAPILADASRPADCPGIAPFFPRRQEPLPRRYDQ